MYLLAVLRCDAVHYLPKLNLFRSLMGHPLRERKTEIEPAATEATTNNTGDLVAVKSNF